MNAGNARASGLPARPIPQGQATDPNGSLELPNYFEGRTPALVSASRYSMGNVFNYPTNPAPNEQYLWVQRPVACNEVGQDWVPNALMMPHVANVLSISEWTNFMNRVSLCVNDFDQKVAQMGCLILGISIPLGVAIGLTVQFATHNRVPLGGSPCIPLLLIGFYFQNKRMEKNHAVDRQIH